jgi:ribonucleoside-diphosphate reductase alpha chain
VSGQDAYEGVDFRKTSSEIRNPDGSVVFQAKDIEVPKGWSQVACDVLAQKYFRKRGLPAALKRVEENEVPSWLWRSVPDEKALAKLPKDQRDTEETSAKQVFHRLAGTWTYWGWKGGYFDSEDDAQAYYDEMCLMLARQMGAPNSPQWFNTGLHWAYGIDGPGQGHFYVDYKSGKLTRSSPTPASSSRSRTTWSASAASWTSGCAKRGCSNMARAPEPTSPSCAAAASLYPAAGAPRGS